MFYTPGVLNAPGAIDSDLFRCRDRLTQLARRPVQREREEKLEAVRRRDREHEANPPYRRDWLLDKIPQLRPTYGQVEAECWDQEMQIGDPTALVLVDEADRLRMASLEQLRSIFDSGGIGLVLIGMPGLEKRLARFPQFYSRIGFVHEFRPLAAEEIGRLLAERYWTALGVVLPETPLGREIMAAIVRTTGGNFRLLNRLLAQMERIVEINGLAEVTGAVVEAARESLVIGQA